MWPQLFAVSMFTQSLFTFSVPTSRIKAKKVVARSSSKGGSQNDGHLGMFPMLYEGRKQWHLSRNIVGNAIYNIILMMQTLVQFVFYYANKKIVWTIFGKFLHTVYHVL